MVKSAWFRCKVSGPHCDILCIRSVPPEIGEGVDGVVDFNFGDPHGDLLHDS